MILDLYPKVATMRQAFLIISLILFMDCSGDACEESVVPQKITLEVDRLEQKLFTAKSPREVADLLGTYPEFSTHFLHADQYPSDSILANQIFSLIQNEAIDTLYQESLEAFSRMDDLVLELEESLGRLTFYYPQTQIPKIQTVVTGLYNDLFVSNEFIIIGMDFFIGQGASYKPQQIPNYILKRYEIKHLPANIMQFISSQYIRTSSEETMLAAMIDYGKSYYLLSKILPRTPGNILIGYTQDEWNNSFDNDEVIWANFVENKLLFETNHQMKQKFLGERPSVYEIGNKCPGRIGRWVGWQIVNAYAEKTGVCVTELMDEADTNKIFRLSQYKPSGS